MPVSELLSYAGPTLAAIAPILGAFWWHRRGMRKLQIYQLVIESKQPSEAVAIINAMKLDTPWKPKPEPGSVPSRDEKAPPQLPGEPAAGRDDLSDRRGGAGGDRADPDEPGEDEAGAA